MIRVICWMKRFCWNARSKERRINALAVQEIEEAETILFKSIQNEEFNEDIVALSNNQPLPKRSKLSSLSPYIDEEGVLRVGGRLSKATIPSSAKHQVILPGKHYAVKLLIGKYHDISHFGTEYVLSTMRQRFLIINGRI